MPVSIVGYAVAYGAAGALKPGAFGGVANADSTVAVVGVFAFAGLVLVGLLSLLTMAATEERQRVGDLVAGTYVSPVAPVASAAPARAASASAAGSSPPVSA